MKQSNLRALAPVLSTRKHKRARVRLALEALIASDTTNPHEKAAVRRFLGELGRIERLCPNTTEVTLFRDGGTVVLWVYEPVIADSEHGPSVVLPWSQHFNGLYAP